MTTMKDCNQCGKCCIRYGGGSLTATTSEIDWWEDHRPDVYAYVRDGNIWVSPVTGKQMSRCPWLRKLPKQEKYICRIYDVRPEDCKQYPVNIDEMVRDECEMLERRDLVNPRKAQRDLDLLMADSRPALGRES